MNFSNIAEMLKNLNVPGGHESSNSPIHDRASVALEMRLQDSRRGCRAGGYNPRATL